MNGLSYQPNSGNPSAFQARRPDFSTFARAIETPTSLTDVGPMLNNTAGKTSNATIQYARVVPMKNDFDRAVVYNLNRGTLSFVVSLNAKDDPLVVNNLTVTQTLNGETTVSGSLGNRARNYKHAGQEVSEIVSWPFLSATSPDDRTTLRLGGQDYVNPTYGMTVQNATLLLSERSVLMPGVLDSNYIQRVENSAFLQPVPQKNPSSWSNVIRSNGEAKTPYSNLKVVKAFQKLDTALLSSEKLGALVPDGMVINKYETEDNAMDQAMLDASQHGLFNIAVAGHSLCTSWASFEGKRKRDALAFPRHELYVLIVGTPVNLLPKSSSNSPQKNTTSVPTGYAASITNGESLSYVNLRYQRANSNQMYNLSSMRNDEDAHSILGKHEYVLGAWRIASVIDTAASKLDVDGAPLNMKSSYALTTSIRIRWVSALDLYEKFDFKPRK